MHATRLSLLLILTLSAAPTPGSAQHASNWEQYKKLTPRDQDLFAIQSSRDRFSSEPPFYLWRIGMATSNCLRADSALGAFPAALDRCLKMAGAQHSQLAQRSSVASTQPSEDAGGFRPPPGDPAISNDPRQRPSRSNSWRTEAFKADN